MPYNLKIDPSDDDFGTICVCAVRYALGRQTYMPTLVQDFVLRYITQINRNSLVTMERDVEDAETWGGYGDERIDKPRWLNFLAKIKAEQIRRIGESEQS